MLPLLLIPIGLLIWRQTKLDQAKTVGAQISQGVSLTQAKVGNEVGNILTSALAGKSGLVDAMQMAISEGDTRLDELEGPAYSTRKGLTFLKQVGLPKDLPLGDPQRVDVYVRRNPSGEAQSLIIATGNGTGTKDTIELSKARALTWPSQTDQ